MELMKAHGHARVQEQVDTQVRERTQVLVQVQQHRQDLVVVEPVDITLVQMEYQQVVE
jgi:hypothetical protein